MFTSAPQISPLSFYSVVVAIGKPTGLVTFGDLANTFVEAVLNAGAFFNRIDVVFDRYYKYPSKVQPEQGDLKALDPLEG